MAENKHCVVALSFGHFVAFDLISRVFSSVVREWTKTLW